MYYAEGDILYNSIIDGLFRNNSSKSRYFLVMTNDVRLGNRVFKLNFYIFTMGRSQFTRELKYTGYYFYY